MTSQRDYTIKYIDPENELINVSDDEDLLTAYELSENGLNGSLKFMVEFKKP
jgi:PB1 domain